MVKPEHPLFAELAPEAALLLAFSHPDASPTWLEQRSRWISEETRWPRILAAADGHGVLPLVYRNLKILNPSPLPNQAEADLWSRNRSLVHHNMLLAGELVRVVRAFQNEGVEVLSFKGPLLAQALYGDLGLRQFRDLDILVRKSQLEEALRILDKLGYHPHIIRSSRRRAAAHRYLYQEELVHETHSARVDLHWRLTAIYARVPKMARDPWKTTTSQTFQGIRVPGLAPHDRLIYLCQHGSKHGWQRLIWAADVARAASLPHDSDWHAILQQAHASGGRRILLLGLSLVSQLWDITLPETVLKSMRAEPTLDHLTRQVCRFLLAERGGAAAVGLNRQMFYCRTLEGGRDKAAYLLGRALTPNEPDWRRLPLPRPFLFLYFPLRIARLAVVFAAEMVRRIFRRDSG